MSPPVSPLESFAAGGFGGVCLVLTGHPMDLVKVKQQTMKSSTSMVNIIGQIVSKEGLRGLYRGVSAPLVGVSPMFAVVMWGYDLGLALVSRAHSTLGGSPRPAHQSPSLLDSMAAGAFSALPAAAITAPVERVKCILQVQTTANAKYSGMWDCATSLYRGGGLRSLYKGWEMTLVRDVPGSIAYFGVYEGLKAAWARPDGSHSDFSVLMAGGFGGTACWLIATPADVIKSRVQVETGGSSEGAFSVLRSLLREGGVGALYKGIGPTLVRAFPANAAMFYGVHVAKTFFSRLHLDAAASS